MVSTDSNAEQTEVLRWYTAARRLQRLVGKAPGGGYYPGGPYPITAIFGAGVVLLVLTVTNDLIWSTGDWLTDSVLIPCGAALVVLFALKKVKPGGRNPLSAGWALCAAFTSPSYGRYRGRALKANRPHRVRHRINAELTGAVVSTRAPSTTNAEVTERTDAAKVLNPTVATADVSSAEQPAPESPRAATPDQKRPRARRRLRVRPALKAAATESPLTPAAEPAPRPEPSLSSIQRRLADVGERRAS